MITKLKKVKSRMWFGNGMGYDPAQYTVDGMPDIRVESRVSGSGWIVIWNDGNDYKLTDGFHDARAIALEIANR